jgi:hypothetical protein
MIASSSNFVNISAESRQKCEKLKSLKEKSENKENLPILNENQAVKIVRCTRAS